MTFSIDNDKLAEKYKLFGVRLKTYKKLNWVIFQFMVIDILKLK